MSQNLLKIQNEILARFRKLHFVGFADELENQFMNPTIYDSINFLERIESCLDHQDIYQKNRRATNLIKAAKLKDKLHLSDLKLTPSSGVSKELLMSLTSNKWVALGIPVIVMGQTGVGKTALCSALGFNCCLNGISVRYYRTSELIVELLYQKAGDRLKMFKKLNNIKVLILDDFGIEPMDDASLNILYKLIDDRHKLNPLVIATQLKEQGLVKLLTGDIAGDGLVDRLFNPCYKIELKGESRRKAIGEAILLNS